MVEITIRCTERAECDKAQDLAWKLITKKTVDSVRFLFEESEVNAHNTKSHEKGQKTPSPEQIAVALSRFFHESGYQQCNKERRSSSSKCCNR